MGQSGGRKVGDRLRNLAGGIAGIHLGGDELVRVDSRALGSDFVVSEIAEQSPIPEFPAWVDVRTTESSE